MFLRPVKNRWWNIGRGFPLGWIKSQSSSCHLGGQLSNNRSIGVAILLHSKADGLIMETAIMDPSAEVPGVSVHCIMKLIQLGMQRDL